MKTTEISKNDLTMNDLKVKKSTVKKVFKIVKDSGNTKTISVGNFEIGLIIHDIFLIVYDEFYPFTKKELQEIISYMK